MARCLILNLIPIQGLEWRSNFSTPSPFLFSVKLNDIKLRNVNFSYPGSKNKTNALNDISLSIKPGALVVIVGANGSGKSTIIKLLTRLYDATSGEVLVDGMPVQNYRGVELRQAMATFTQDHKLFPLSLYENIALGYPECSSDTAMVLKASENGGASTFITKLKDGLQTILEPQNDTYSINVPSDPDHPLHKKMQALDKKIDISGGERQRVVAYEFHIFSPMIA